ncbi:MAG TPA: hypothetical protein VM925_20780 [Labilithrix sp.]|nr:hypothetical protein [Labilithrix sp.]
MRASTRYANGAEALSVQRLGEPCGSTVALTQGYIGAVTFFAPCPRCHTVAEVAPEGDRFGCAACGFDYATLRTDETTRTAWMRAALRAGPAEKLGLLLVHRHVFGLSPKEANARVVAFAEEHGVLTRGGRVTAGALAGVVVLVIVIGVVLLLR